MNKILKFTDKEKTLKTMERNLEILNQNHEKIKHLNFCTALTILASDIETFEHDLKAVLFFEVKNCTPEKLKNVFDYLTNLEQFEEGTGRWFYQYVYFDDDEQKFGLIYDYQKTITDSYTFVCKTENLLKANILIQ